MPILFIQTGGTIDKDYPRTMASYAFEIGAPAVAKMMRLIRPSFRYRIVEAFKKDSLDIISQDRQLLVNLCQSVKEQHLIITHGTDTMIETAKKLASITNKTIVLTGAMLPAIHAKSDAMFNVGTAVGAIELLKPGVYIAMSGKVFPWQKCVKSGKRVAFVGKK